MGKISHDSIPGVSTMKQLGPSPFPHQAMHDRMGIGWLDTALRSVVRHNDHQAATASEHLVVLAPDPVTDDARARLTSLLGPVGTAYLRRQLLRATLDTARQVGNRRGVAIEVHACDAGSRDVAALVGTDMTFIDQRKRHSGQPLRSGSSDAHNDDVRKVVFIGFCCPLLDSDVLCMAFDALDDHDVVLGPTRDDRSYLIGMLTNRVALLSDIAKTRFWVPSELKQACLNDGLNLAELPAMPIMSAPDDLADWASARFAHAPARPRLSVIIPSRNEQNHLAATIASALVADNIEIIVADGRSTDRTIEIARQFGVTVTESPPSRGAQMNSAAEVARGDILLFLHADTLLPPGYDAVVYQTLATPNTSAGAFTLAIDAKGMAPRLIEWGVYARSRFCERPYGDQAIFMSTETFHDSGRFPNLPYMEDFAMLPCLKRRGHIRVVPDQVMTSARRWEKHGWTTTTLMHQWAKLRYLLFHKPDAGGTGHASVSRTHACDSDA